MKKKLPEYIVKCFQAAGYDDMDTIAKMDTSENPGNSISKIEQYIKGSLVAIQNMFMIYRCPSHPLNSPQDIVTESAILFMK